MAIKVQTGIILEYIGTQLVFVHLVNLKEILQIESLEMNCPSVEVKRDGKSLANEQIN